MWYIHFFPIKHTAITDIKNQNIVDDEAEFLRYEIGGLDYGCRCWSLTIKLNTLMEVANYMLIYV